MRSLPGRAGRRDIELGDQDQGRRPNQATAPKNVESTLNTELGRLFIPRHPLWNQDNVHAERTGTLRDHPGRKIDILVENPGGQPVAIETEFQAGPQVRREAEDRLGMSLRSSGRTIESAISVVLPEDLKHGDPGNLESARLRFATHQLVADSEIPERFPREGWIDGTVDDLVDTVEVVSLSQRRLSVGARILELAISDATAHLRNTVTSHALGEVAAQLHQEDGEQTTRMAVSILASAFVFHYAIEDQTGIPRLERLREQMMIKSELIDIWKEILRVNYWPIFSIALELLRYIPARVVPYMLEILDQAAQKLARMGATTFHDLAGRMFQTLISDRKFLATFYTLPTSAHLLAELAVERLDVDWADPARLAGLRIADFACGTGALLSAAQRAVYRRHRHRGGNDATLHRHMMEQSLIGTDIMPAATHITASMLSSAHPGVTYDRSMIHTIPYGTDEWGTSIGALDLLEGGHATSLFGTGGTRIAGRVEEATGRQARERFEIDDDSCDLVLMNPPFTRPTGHEAAKVSVPVPSFAGFGTSDEEQRAMSAKLGKIGGLFGHGNAGLASNFMDLAHRKLREGGAMALVLPFAFASGKAWSRARTALAKRYSDIRVVSIATSGSTDRAFSADTGMAECLVVATKAGTSRVRGTAAVRYSNLAARPKSLTEAHDLYRRVSAGENSIGGSIDDGGAAGVRAIGVANAASALEAGRLMLPRETQGFAVPVTRLGEVADRGLYHMDINGRPPRGPFEIREPALGEIPTYPTLWRHRADEERKLVVWTDTCGDARAGAERKASTAWKATASRLHFSVDFRLNSQSLAMCVTPEESLGGRAWANVLPHEPAYETPLLLWANSSPGLLLYWWRGTRQQQGRAQMKITAMPALRVLDPRKLSAEQLEMCWRIFRNFAGREFLPANEAYQDAARQDLDRAVLVDLLGMPTALVESLALLRAQWCAEPSVHGGKSTAPRVSRHSGHAPSASDSEPTGPLA